METHYLHSFNLTLMYLRFSILLLLLLATGCDSTESDATAEGPIETPLDAALLETVLQMQLRAAEVHLNNYGEEDEERDNSWLRSEDAFFRFGSAELRFTIPESRTRAGPFRLFYYVRDLNTFNDSATVSSVISADEITLVARIPFEQEGTEFKGHCLTSTFLGTRGCFGSRDRIAPDLQLSDASIELLLRPVVLNGSLSLEAVAVAFEGTVQAGGICTIDLGVDVCDVLTNYKETIRETVETLVLDELRQEAFQAFLAAEVQPLLGALGIGEVLALRVEGEQLIIVHSP